MGKHSRKQVTSEMEGLPPSKFILSTRLGAEIKNKKLLLFDLREKCISNSFRKFSISILKIDYNFNNFNIVWL
jgi:hypothetical protein